MKLVIFNSSFIHIFFEMNLMVYITLSIVHQIILRYQIQPILCFESVSVKLTLDNKVEKILAWFRNVPYIIQYECYSTQPFSYPIVLYRFFIQIIKCFWKLLKVFFLKLGFISLETAAYSFVIYKTNHLMFQILNVLLSIIFDKSIILYNTFVIFVTIKQNI